MSDVLHEAETRGQVARTTREVEEAAIIDAMRAEIRRANPRDAFDNLYEEARRQLPILEQGLAEARVWLQRLVKIAHTSGASLAIFQDVLDAINQHCATGAHELRRGLAGYEQLRFADIALAVDPRQVDETQRVVLIGRIRQDLRSWDGRLSFVTQQMARLDEAIRKGGWPRFSGVPATPTVTIQEPAGRTRGDIPVDIGTPPRPPI